MIEVILCESDIRFNILSRQNWFEAMGITSLYFYPQVEEAVKIKLGFWLK